jgi:hypothetical protein
MPWQLRVSVLIKINKLTFFFYEYLDAGRRMEREVVKTA